MANLTVGMSSLYNHYDKHLSRVKQSQQEHSCDSIFCYTHDDLAFWVPKTSPKNQNPEKSSSNRTKPPMTLSFTSHPFKNKKINPVSQKKLNTPFASLICWDFFLGGTKIPFGFFSTETPTNSFGTIFSLSKKRYSYEATLRLFQDMKALPLDESKTDGPKTKRAADRLGDLGWVL